MKNLPNYGYNGNMPTPTNPIRFADLVAANPLNAAEDDFRKRMKEGKPCVFGNHAPKEGDETNTIRADLIRFFAWGGDEDAPIRGNLIALQGAWIPDILDLAHIPSTYSLVLPGCNFAAYSPDFASIMMPHSAFHFLNLSGSFLKGGLVGDGVKIASDILLEKGFTSEGEVRLFGAQIEGKVTCCGGNFKTGNGQKNSLNAEAIKVKGDFAMRDGFVANGKVSLVGAYIGGELTCNNGQFKNEIGVAINADAITVKGGVHIGGGLCAEGGVRLIGANIGKGLLCDGGKFVNQGKDAFCADNMKVSGSVFMRNGFCAEGKVQLLGATISEDWYCNGANLQNEECQALVADRVRVGGNLHLHDGFSAKGEVRLSGAHIRGIVSCRGGVFDNKKGEKIPEFGTNAALVAQGTKIDSNLLLTSGFSADGAVVLHNAKIGNSVLCNGGTFNGDVVMDSVKIGNSLFWTNVGGKGECNLSFASAEVFDYDEKSLHGFKFILDGFSYKRFGERKSVESRLNWLNSQKPFSPQPFEHAANVLFAMGYNNDAREVLLEKEKLLTKHEKIISLWTIGWKFWRKCWNTFAGYGYRLTWTALWMAFFIVSSAGLFGYADSKCRIVPHQPIVMTLDKYTPLRNCDKCTDDNRPTKVMAQAYPDYPRFGAFVYSLDVFIPYFSLHKETHWYPKPEEGYSSLLAYLRVWYWIEIIAGWILTSLLVLTITGLLKPRQSSLE